MHRPLTLAALVLAFAPLAAAQKAPSPRELLERAHYAEETQHDLAAAEKGYREASAAAAKAGDAKLAAEAEAALDRVLVRAGKKQAPREQEIPETAIQILMASSERPGGEWDQLIEDLHLYGDAVVPALGKMLAPAGQTFSISSSQAAIWTNPAFAAQALARIDTPEARTILEQSLRSNDPLLRRYVASSAHHVELLLMAAEDPVEGIRSVAINSLASHSDARAAPTMEREAKRGEWRAFRWMCRHAPRKAFEMLEAGEVPGEQTHNEKTLRDALVRSPSGREMVEFLLQRSVASTDLDTRIRARNTARAVLDATGLSKETQPWLLDLAKRTGDPILLTKLKDEPLENVLPILIEIAAKERGPLDPDLDKAISVGVGQSRVMPPVGLLIELYKAVAPRVEWTDQALPKGARVLAGWIAQTLQDSAFTAEFLRLVEGFTPAERRWWKSFATQWASSRIRESASGDQLPQEGSFPATWSMVADWLIEEREPVGVALLAGIEGVDAKRLLAVDLEALQRRQLDSSSRYVMLAIERAAKVDLQATVDSIWRSVTEVRDDPAAVGIVHASLQALPLEGRILLMERLWKEPSPDALRSVAMRDFIGRPGAHPRFPEALLELYPGTPLEARSGIIRALRGALYEPAIPLLGEALRSPSQAIRTEAQAAFAEFRKQREALEELDAWMNASSEQRAAVGELRALLESPERDVVLGAVRALGVIKARAALPELVKLLARDDPDLKRAVQEAIDRIAQ